MGDLSVMIAPKKLVLVCGKDDNIFPLHGVKDTFDIIKNIYRVLMTRGKKGCYIYACDPEVRNYFKRMLNN
jgi:DUF2075 family protein